MRSIDANTGRLYAPPEWREDVRQDALDRLLTPVGTRPERPEYGVAALNPDEITFAAASTALLSGSGAIASVDNAEFTDGALRLAVTARSAGFRLTEDWGYQTDVSVGGSRRHFYFFESGGVQLPDAWAVMPPAPTMGNLIVRHDAIGMSTAIRLVVNAANLWDVNEPGYAEQYAGWYFYFRRGQVSEWLALDRPGTPHQLGSNARYQWGLPYRRLAAVTDRIDAGDNEGWQVRLFRLEAV